MMDIWSLPTSVNVAGVDWHIRTDYRVVIDVLIALNNPDFDDMDKTMYMLMSMIVDFDNLPPEQWKEACQKVSEFIDMGEQDENENKKPHPKLMDWEQDATLVIPAVNKVAGKEIRCEEYIHWWTFLSWYMEIGECNFTHIISIRAKKKKNKKLEKWEMEFYRNNKSLIDLKDKLSMEEIEEQKRLEELFG